jgi:hypothetical protein
LVKVRHEQLVHREVVRLDEALDVLANLGSGHVVQLALCQMLGYDGI